MIVTLSAALLQAASLTAGPTVEIVTAAEHVVVTGSASATQVDVRASGGALRPVVAATRSGFTIRDANASTDIVRSAYEITVPGSSKVTIRVRCKVVPGKPCPNATVRISGVMGVSYESFDGRAVIMDIGGDVKASSLTGSLEVRRVAGLVEASSQTNAIDVTDVAGNTTVRSTTGMIALSSIRGNVSATNTTGEIRLSGDISRRSRYELATDIGQIRLHISDTANATVDVNAPSEAIRVRIPGVLVTSSRDRQRTIIAGDGSARISARTLSGGVDIGRRR
jgi:hypothetical protein